jgi:hypothetical protein
VERSNELIRRIGLSFRASPAIGHNHLTHIKKWLRVPSLSRRLEK